VTIGPAEEVPLGVRMTVPRDLALSFRDTFTAAELDPVWYLQKSGTLPAVFEVAGPAATLAAAPWMAKVAAALVKWAEGLRDREVTFRADGQVKKIKGYSASDVERLIRAAQPTDEEPAEDNLD
jgi:hypothetical protein